VFSFIPQSLPVTGADLSVEEVMKFVVAAALAASVLTASAAQAQMNVKEIGSFHIGGQEAVLEGLPTREIVFTPGAPALKVDPNGEFETGQMYVQFIKLAAPKARYPLLMWHGGGLSGVTWETKPDGKPGWQQFFLAAGHDVYVSDAVERGRSGWSRYPEIYKSEPFFRAKKEGWDLFRIGPAAGWDRDLAKRKAFEGQQFPVEAYDQFGKQAVPRWSTNDSPTQAAYDALVKRICPCVIMVHSQGGNFGFTAALNNPDMVKALIAIEPSGAPNPERADAAKVKGVPHLVVFGDNLDQSLWPRLVPNVRKWAEAVKTGGGSADWMELPQQGIKGNTHMLMMDRNSDQIAGLVNDWLVAKGLTTK
jgi:pimeloyl-ACP methyl ester carboxylesterase